MPPRLRKKSLVSTGVPLLELPLAGLELLAVDELVEDRHDPLQTVEYLAGDDTRHAVIIAL
jgi:hypothetical protein